MIRFCFTLAKKRIKKPQSKLRQYDQYYIHSLDTTQVDFILIHFMNRSFCLISGQPPFNLLPNILLDGQIIVNHNLVALYLSIVVIIGLQANFTVLYIKS